MVNFDKKVNRIGTNSFKWDHRLEYFGRDDVLPLWVADTDFELMDEIKKALLKRVNEANFGYARTSDEFYQSIIDWSKRRHNWDVEKETIVPNTSVLSLMRILLQYISKPKDKVLMFSPIYYPFFTYVKQFDRIPVYYDMKMEDNLYKIDFDVLEDILIKENPTVFIFCNPHNPSGRVWTFDEQKQLVSLLEKYKIEIISDEIHKDIIFSNNTYVPMEVTTTTYRDHIYTLTAPTKTFNLAGIKVSYAIIHDKKLRNKVEEESQYNGTQSLTTLADDASVTAYTMGDYWVNEFIEYIEGNYNFMKEGLSSTSFKVMESQGTFLIWISFEDYHIPHEEMKQILLDVGLGIQMGHIFGDAGDSYIRLNVGTQRFNIEKAVKLFENAHKILTNK